MAEDEGPTAPRRRIHNIGSSKSVKMHQRSSVDDLTWSNIRDCSDHSKTEKFLWDANISTDLNQTDNFLLKEALVHCTVKYMKSRPIQMRAYQLLQDLSLSTTEENFYSDDELRQRFKTTLDSLHAWKGNEHVVAACFDYLAALYFKHVKHDFPDTNEGLLGITSVVLADDKRSKAVLRAVVAFLSRVYEYASESSICSAPSLDVLAHLPQLLSSFSDERVLVYQCSVTLSAVANKAPEALQEISDEVVSSTLRALAHNHKNHDICAALMGLLAGVAVEERHISYMLQEEEEEFDFICRSVPIFQGMQDTEAVDAVLTIVKRSVNSRCMQDLFGDVDAIGGAVRAARTHRPSCSDPQSCLGLSPSEGGCGITPLHLALCSSIEDVVAGLLLKRAGASISDVTSVGSSVAHEEETNSVAADGRVAESICGSERSAPLEKRESSQLSAQHKEVKPVESNGGDAGAVIAELQQEVAVWRGRYEDVKNELEELQTQQQKKSDVDIPFSVNDLQGSNSTWSPIAIQEFAVDSGDGIFVEGVDDFTPDEYKYNQSVSSGAASRGGEEPSSPEEMHDESKGGSGGQDQEMDEAYAALPAAEVTSAVRGVRGAVEYVTQTQARCELRVREALNSLKVCTTAAAPLPKKSLDVNKRTLKEFVLGAVEFFQLLRHQQAASTEKFSHGDACVITRSLLRRVLISPHLGLMHPRRLPVCEVDILMHVLPTVVDLEAVVFALVACACKRIKLRHIRDEEEISSMLEKLLRLVHSYSHSADCLAFGGGRSFSGPCAVPDSIQSAALQFLSREQAVLDAIFAVYSRHSEGMTMDAVMLFARDFKIFPVLVTADEIVSVCDDLLSQSRKKLKTPKVTISIQELKVLLVEISLMCDCLDTMEEELVRSKGPVSAVINRLASLLWYMESSGGRERLLDRDRTVRTIPPFKLNWRALLVDEPWVSPSSPLKKG